MSDRRIVDMPPPPIVRRRIEDLRHLEPPAALLDDVLTEVDDTPQVPRTPRWITSAAALAVAAAVVVAAFLLSRGGNVGSEATPSPSPSATAPSAGGTPTPIDELPVAGTLQTTIPTEPFDIVTLGAFDVIAEGIYYLDRSGEAGGFFTDRPGGETRLQYFDLSTRRTTTIARGLGVLGPGLSASRDGRTVYFTRIDSASDELMLVDKFR